MNWLTVLGLSFLMVLGGIITWLIKSRIEELRATEERLTGARRLNDSAEQPSRGTLEI